MDSPEATLVVMCVRESDGVSAEDIRTVCSSVRDWPVVVDLATRHRVVAYVRRGLARADYRPPTETERALGMSLVMAADMLVRLKARLQRIAAQFAEDGVPLLVLKGPVLAPLLYAAPSFRPYDDLDIQVPREYVVQAEVGLNRCALVECAYPAEVARGEHADHLHAGAEFHRMFLSADERELVELHLDTLQLGMRMSPEGARWARAVPADGIPGVLMLSLPDQLVHLSVHAHKHGFNRLMWLKDLDLLIRKLGNELDWETAFEIARTEGVTASVWYALHLTQSLLGTPVPAVWLRQTRPSAPLRALYHWIWPTAHIAALDGHMRRRAIQFHAAESWRGMLPSLILMGRRRTRVWAIAESVLH